MSKRPIGTESARVIQVIETKSTIGSGTEDDPFRPIAQYWDLDGNILGSAIIMEENPVTAQRKPMQ